MRLIFMGTPGFALPTLHRIARDYEVRAVYTRAPRPAGRKLESRPSPIEHAARSLGIQVFTPTTLRDEEIQTVFRSHGADAAIVVAYGLILPKSVLESVSFGCLNLHASLLPRWRGAAPINRAIMAGDTETGVCVMKMEEGLDTGPVAMSERVEIREMTAGALGIELASIGADLMAQAVHRLEFGQLDFTPQPTVGVTYARKIDKAETRIDWSKSWRDIYNQCRGLSPSPGAWFEIMRRGKPERVKVMRVRPGVGAGPPGTILDDDLTVACGEGAIRLVQVQRAGRETIDAKGFWHGLRLSPGAMFG
jgi:methionyl-tRNA formyltransferase